jgi:hypothetical protein
MASSRFCAAASNFSATMPSRWAWFSWGLAKVALNAVTTVCASLPCVASPRQPARYRLIVRRDGKAVRLSTRRGHDWTDRYPAIAGGAAILRARSFTLDGEAVVCGANGVAMFDALHRCGRVTNAILQAFDLLELDGVDYRPLPLSRRKDRLARLLARVQVGLALPMPGASWCSGRPALWASKASYRSGITASYGRGCALLAFAPAPVGCDG